jgi:hypothetical protein
MMMMMMMMMISFLFGACQQKLTLASLCTDCLPNATPMLCFKIPHPEYKNSRPEMRGR